MLRTIAFCTALLLPLTICAQEPGKNNSAGKLNWSVQASWPVPGKPIAIAQSLDNKKVFILAADAKVYIFTPEGIQLGTLPVEPGVTAIDIAARGETLYLVNGKTNTYSAIDISFNQKIDTVGAPVRGKVDAPVTLVLFSDFECPWCGKLEPVLAELLTKNPDKLRIVFKHMPLPMHPYAEPAALAAIAAQKQGKFWEMHDALFQTTNWTPNTIDEAAVQIGLNMDKFRTDLVSPEVQAQLAKDLRDAQAADVNATPSLFINSQPVKDRALSNLQKMVNEALGTSGGVQ
ncbi:MAG: thioredoxin domain-containing protein [Proteobacteria bacterium]|nr:thioredoxin domain-containing protein [Pseudomonadota bacterium]